ncbi:MAG: MBL fold metallo-hydrolase, partial [Vicinamibacteria bacterium]|nr:MBL fold metallo-hydrolase [Vicinamibacteria bacterium]
MRLAPHCFGLFGFAFEAPWEVNAGLVVGETRTLIVDTGGSYWAAATIHGYAQAVRPDNELIVVNTEPHLDHILGNGFFRERGVPIYGHALIARRPADLEAEIADCNQAVVNEARRARGEGGLIFADTSVCNPDHRIERDQAFDLGGIEARVLLTPGHTPANLCIDIPEEDVLYCGDTIVEGYLPNLEAGAVDDRRHWLHSLDRIETCSPRQIVPGHGRLLKGDAIPRAIARMR